MRRRNRVIPRNPLKCNYFLVDACFLVNKYLKPAWIPDAGEKKRIQHCHEWWTEIEAQLADRRGKVYVPDLCIAEAFKAFAQKNYRQKVFRYPTYYGQVKKALRRDIHLPITEARKQKRMIKYHDIATNRDIVIAVDRFFERMYKMKINIQIVDLMLLAVGKYLMDFYGFTRKELFIVTIDEDLYRLARALTDVPMVFNPLQPRDAAAKAFVD